MLVLVFVEGGGLALGDGNGNGNMGMDGIIEKTEYLYMLRSMRDVCIFCHNCFLSSCLKAGRRTESITSRLLTDPNSTEIYGVRSFSRQIL